MDELADRLRSVRPESGILFARNIDGEEKTKARDRVLALFQREQWPDHLHVLTMPGLQWRFERKLLGARQVGWMRHRAPYRTYFTSFENDRTIFYGAVTQMPGLHTPESKLRRLRGYSFAEMGVATRYASFFFANIDDFMKCENWDRGWDAAWLDYTGPLSVDRLAVIAQFYRRWVKRILVVTALKARWNERTSRAISKAGGHSEWLRKHIDGEVLHDIEYFDTSPMAQFAVRKRYWQSPLV
jgi:hypothetical protein